jgi:bifunctional non-homologous end joining protein LigD
MTRFEKLAAGIATELKGKRAILDGEIVCVDPTGRQMFNELFHKTGEPVYYAFDLLWLDGQDLSNVPTVERKAKLEKLIPNAPRTWGT